MTKVDTANIQANAQLSQWQEQLTQLKSLKNEKEVTIEAAEEAGAQFEALLLHQMMKAMWATVDETGLMGENSNQGQIYRDMLNQAISDSVAEGPGVGVKQFLKEELLRMEGASQQGSGNNGKDPL